KLALPPLVDPVLSQQYDDHNQESNRLLFECGVRLRGIVDKPRGEPLKLFHEQPRPRLPQVAHDSASRSRTRAGNTICASMTSPPITAPGIPSARRRNHTPTAMSRCA